MTEEELRALLGNEQQVNDIPPDADDIPPSAVPQDPFSVPEIPADPFAAFSAPEPGVSAAEPDGTAEAVLPEKPNRHLFLYTMLTLLVLGVLAFAVFCVIWDIRNGTASGRYRAGNIVKVELVQHRRSDEADTEADENGKYTFEGIAQNVMPSIVEIYTYKDGVMNGAGSGIILSEEGYIATNSHVVTDVSAYSVRLYGDSSDSLYSAVLVGHDRKTDLAVLKISADNLKPAKLGNSDDVHIGETVCALGNPAGLSSSITTGIISGVNRKVRAQSNNFEMDCFQTDAAISPGNSGGALVDMYGQVIGIVSSKYGNSIVFGGDYEGLGFAITINQALPILKELAENGYVSGRVRIGINYLPNEAAWDEAAKKNITLPEELRNHGIWITSIADDSPLNDTPVQVHDWILTMDGQEVTDGDNVTKVTSGKVGGESMHCRIARVEDDGTVSTFEVDFAVLEDQSGDY